MKAAHAILPFVRGMDEHERLCLLGLSHVEFLRPREKFTLITIMKGAAPIFDLALADIARLVGRKLSTRLWQPGQILDSARQTQNDLTECGAQSIFYWDTGYPAQLREIYDPPVTLFIRGTLPDNGDALAGIVGTRFPTGAARTAAFRLGFDLGREGICVVSGLARGIDREAHEGCVEAGGRSVAVLGNGIDRIYPVSSRPAARALLDRGGAILSEYPPGVPPLQYHFPARNRIISGLCRAVVIVQAPERSGALITAEYALDQGRDLWVHAAGIPGSAGAGTGRLADAGAPVISGAADILRDWGMSATAFPIDSRHGSAADFSSRTLEEELDGNCAVHGGKTYWRT